MFKKLSILTILLCSALFMQNCKDDGGDDPVAPVVEPTESKVVTVSSTSDGVAETSSGIKINVIPGTVPPNQNDESAEVTFSIESNVESPGALGFGANLVGGITKFGPEGFNFRWPVKITLPYPASEDPTNLKMVYYDTFEEMWVTVPISEVDYTNHKISTDHIQLGYYALAKFPASMAKVDYPSSDGGFRYYGEQGYYYTLTVASVSNYKYPAQAGWYSNPVGMTASSGSHATGGPRQPTTIHLVQATYSIWITRTKPGNMSTLPKIETYTVAATGTLSGPVTYTSAFSTGNGWVDLQLPGGGQWVDGGPEGWPVPTATYGTGDFQATLTWVNNDSHKSDVDLHLYGPNDMHVYWWDDISSDGVFELDRDWLLGRGNAVENIYSLKPIPSGTYSVYVNLYGGDATNFNVRVIRNGSSKSYSGRASDTNSDGDKDKMILIESFTK